MNCDLFTRLSASANPCGRCVGVPTMRRERFTVVCSGSICRAACLSNANAQPGELSVALSAFMPNMNAMLQELYLQLEGCQVRWGAERFGSRSTTKSGGRGGVVPPNRSPASPRIYAFVRYMADGRS